MAPIPLTLEPDDERSFVFRYVAEEGAVGVFVPLIDAPAVGTDVVVSTPNLVVAGVVGWRNANDSDTPGAGVILELGEDDEGLLALDALIAFVRAIAYLPRAEGS